MAHLDANYLKKRFPNISKTCLKYGIDFTKQPIPVTPTAHYSCGGIKIDLNAKTTISNLYAIGEVSCSGLHGADRLASNSLTDGLVFGTMLINFLKNKIKKTEINEIKSNKNFLINKKNNKKIDELDKRLKNLMWEKVGIIRAKEGISSALLELEKMEKEIVLIEKEGISKEIIELRNMIITAKLITKSAIARKESRGTHFVEDFPTRKDKEWKKHSVINKKGMKFY